MIRYRVREIARSLVTVYTTSTFGSGIAVCLPLVPNEAINDNDEYATTYLCDTIQTSSDVSQVQDHSCYHQKIAGTIEGNVTTDFEDSKLNLGFLKYDGEFHAGAFYSWLSSSGSGPQVMNLSYSSGRYYSVLAPGVLSEASSLQQLRVVDSFGKETFFFGNTYARLVKIGSVAWLYVLCTVNTLSNVMYFTSRVFYPVYSSSTSWQYGSVRVKSKSLTTMNAPKFLYTPEVYFADLIDEAILLAPTLVTVVDLTLRTFYRPDLAILFKTSSVSPSLVDRICKDVRKFADRAVSNVAPPDKNVWSDLCVASIQDCQNVSINSIAYAKDIMALRNEIKSTLDLMRNWKNPRTYLRLFLSSKYGVPLTMSDTKKLVSAVDRLSQSIATWNKSFSVVRSRTSDQPSSAYRSSEGFSRTFNYKVYYTPVDSRVLDCIRTLMNWDVWPTLENDWDLIPLSFILDWFIGINELCSRIDTAIYSQYLDVLSVVATTKTVGDISRSMSSYGVNDVKFTVSRYDRICKSKLDIPSFRLDVGSGFLTHLPEMFAIIASSHH